MKKLYMSLLGLVGILVCAQEVEVRWQKDIKSALQDFLILKSTFNCETLIVTLFMKFHSWYSIIKNIIAF